MTLNTVVLVIGAAVLGFALGRLKSLKRHKNRNQSSGS